MHHIAIEASPREVMLTSGTEIPPGYQSLVCDVNNLIAGK